MMRIRNCLQKSIALVLCLAVIASGLSGCGFLPQKEPSDTTDHTFDPSKAIADAMNLLQENPSRQASLLAGVSAREKVLALTFDGLASSPAMDRVLALLKEYQVTASFFVTGVEAAEDDAVLKKIIADKHSVGSGTLKGRTKMENLSAQELVQDFAYSHSIIGRITGNAPTLVKCRSTKYTPELLAAAAACGFSSAVQSSSFISYQSFNSLDGVRGYVARLERGSILSVKMKGVLQEDEYDAPSEPKDAYMPGERQPGIKDGTQEELPEEERLLQSVEWLLKAAKESGWKIIPVDALTSQASFDLDAAARQALYLQNREANQKKLANEMKMVYTTDRAAALSFYGIGNDAVLGGVLAELKALNMRATFYVSDNDIAEHPDTIKQIVDAGHEIGAAILSKRGLDYLSVCEQIYLVQILMKSGYQVDVQLASQVIGAVTDEVREAASAMGVRLVGYSRIFDTSGSKGTVSAQSMVDSLFRSAGNTVKRGEIFYFRLDYQQQSNEFAAQVLRAIVQRPLSNTGSKYGTRYTLKGVQQLLYSAGAYSYPSPVRRGLVQGKLRSMSESERFSYIDDRYIGNPDTASINQLPGFPEKEIRELDQDGKLYTGGNTIFLTFDDWGTDLVLNRLLDVLKKHNVKANFFIRTEYVAANPNLLRAIGMQGHDIGSHSHRHLPLAQYQADENKFYSLTPKEVAALRQDIVQSYRVLEEVVGDLRNEKGRPVLTRIFRPPTLAVSREGMEAVLDSGYEYIVSGDFSTGDYKSSSTNELYDLMIHGIPVSGQPANRTISSGSIVVMHMSDNAQFTPEAIDQFLTWNASRPEAEQFKFARLSDYLN